MSPIAIAIAGMGRAGQARVRDVAASERFVLRGIVSRRPGVGTRSFAEVLADPAVDAVALCTENALHEAAAREALAARKHVLVEYPLALSLSAAKGLFAGADAAGRILHEEHIELLSDDYRALREEVGRAGPLQHGELHFTGGSGGWVGDPARAGPASFSGIARLHRLLDLLGALALVSASLTPGVGGGFAMRVVLRTSAGADVVWTEERAPELRRGQTARLVFAGVELTRWPRGPAGAVFAEDLAAFAEEIEGRQDAHAARPRILAALALAEEIAGRCNAHPL